MGFVTDMMNLGGGNNEDFYRGIATPDIKDMQLVLTEYVQQGLMTPEEAEYYAQSPSEFAKIQADPQFKEAQMNALSGLQDYASEGGLNAQARGRLHDIAKDEGVRERGAREAIMQNANARGVGGSGLEFLSQLKNQQESAGRQSDRDTQVAADAEMRALDALVKGGSMAGDMRGQDFSEQARIAEAMDAINRFNTGNMNQNSQYNVGVRNDAQKYNLGMAQDISNNNALMKNKQQQYNKELLQQNYANKMDYAGQRSGAAQKDRDIQNNAMSGIEKGISSLAGGAYGGYMSSQGGNNYMNQIPTMTSGGNMDESYYKKKPNDWDYA